MRKLIRLFAVSLLLVACSVSTETADRLLKEENYTEAKKAYSEVLAKDKNNIKALTGLGRSDMMLGDLSLAKNSLGTAIAQIEKQKAVKGDPANAYMGAAYFYRGIINSTEHNDQLSMNDFRTALNYGYDLAETHAMMADALDHVGDPTTARYHLDSALAINPTHLYSLKKRAYIWSLLGNMGDALEDYGRALEVDPSDKMTWANRGYSYLSLEKVDLALADFVKALEIDPDYPQAVMYRGVCMYDKGNLEAAMADFERALVLAPGSPRVYYYRGLINIQTGKKEQGCADLLLAEQGGVYDGSRVRSENCN